MSNIESKRIIYQDYGRKGSVDATIGMYRLAQAIETDMALQGRDFKVLTYNNQIKENMNPSNGTGFKNGILRGKALANNEPWESSWGKTKGEDLARAIVYTLRNQGAYQWPNVRKCVEAMPAPFNELSNIEYLPGNIEEETLQTVLKPVYKAKGYDEAFKALKKVEKSLETAIKEQIEQDRLLKKREFQVLTYATNMKELSKENKALKAQLIEQITSEIEQLNALKPSVTDEKDQKELDESIRKAKKQLKKLQSA